jgi:uncharacterized protein (DUF1810 family)
MADPHDLERFVAAQAGVYAQALAELEAGRKESHWMWFIFPQIAGLGRSPTARLYAVASREEAAAYFSHPLLGRRLVECTKAVLRHAGTPAEFIFGPVDAMKFHSSMTLFDAVAGATEPRFAEALATFFGGEPDPVTLKLLAAASPTDNI